MRKKRETKKSLYKFHGFGVYPLKRERRRTFQLARKVLRSEGDGADPLWPRAGLEPRRGRRCLAGNFSGADATAGISARAGKLLPPQFSQSRVELQTLALAAVDAGTGINTLVREIARRKSGGTRRDELSRGIAAGTARGDCSENLEPIYIRGNRRAAGNFTEHCRGTLPLRFAKDKIKTGRSCL